MMKSPAPKEAIVVEVCVTPEHSLGLEGVCIKSEPSLGDTCVKVEPSCSDTCVKDEILSPELADAPDVSEVAAAAQLYADHVVKDEPVLVQMRRVLCAALGQKLLENVRQEQADPDEIAVTLVKQESKWEAEERNAVQPKWETEMMAASHGEPKNEAEWNMPGCHGEPKNKAERNMPPCHREPKNKAEGNMPASHGEPTVFNNEVKQEECEADDCKLNEPQNRKPAPDTQNRNGPMVFKRIWLPNSDFDDAVIGSTRPTKSQVKRVVVGRSPVQPPVKRILVGSSAPMTVTSQPAQPLTTAIREKRFRNMLEMFPEISPLDIKNILVKHGWNEKRSRDELRNLTRKATSRLRHRPRTSARVLASPDKDPDLTECVKDEPSCSDTCVKDEILSPELADAPDVSEVAAAAQLYADHVVKDEPVLVQMRRVLCAALGQKLLENVRQEQADPDEIAVTLVKQESKWEAEERNTVQPKWETEMMAASHGEPKNEAEWNMPGCHGEPKNKAERNMPPCHREPKNKAEGNMPASHGEPTVFNNEVKQEECEADDCKLNGSTRPTKSQVKRVVVGRSPVQPPVKRILVDSSAPVTVTSQPTQPLITAIRESRCRNMLEMFPEISPLDIKNILVKHGWNEKRSRDELRSLTRKATSRLRHRPRTNARVLASPDKDPDLTAPIWA